MRPPLLGRRRTAGLRPPGRRTLAAALALLVPLTMSLAACGTAPVGAAGATDQGPAQRLRLGYFATVTHAPALVGLARGTFADALDDTTLYTQVFGAGPEALEALNAGAIDAAFLGPSPAINGFVRSDGAGLRIVSGVASGGAQLVVRPGIRSAEDLRGATLATPQLGGTQDVALRTWLTDEGLVNRLRGGGDVRVSPTASATALQLFRDGALDGAWAPEPWASRLVLEGGGHVLVDERDLWPGGAFPSTSLVVSTRFLEEHPDTVAALVEGLLDAMEWLASHPREGAGVVNDSIAQVAGQPLRADVLDRAFSTVEFGPDPLPGALDDLHADAVRIGTTPDAPLEGILDLRLLNRALAERGVAEVPDGGLGQDRPGGPGGQG